jgi:hypothetical protein
MFHVLNGVGVGDINVANPRTHPSLLSSFFVSDQLCDKLLSEAVMLYRRNGASSEAGRVLERSAKDSEKEGRFTFRSFNYFMLLHSARFSQPSLMESRKCHAIVWMRVSQMSHTQRNLELMLT